MLNHRNLSIASGVLLAAAFVAFIVSTQQKASSIFSNAEIAAAAQRATGWLIFAGMLLQTALIAGVLAVGAMPAKTTPEPVTPLGEALANLPKPETV